MSNECKEDYLLNAKQSSLHLSLSQCSLLWWGLWLTLEGQDCSGGELVDQGKVSLTGLAHI